MGLLGGDQANHLAVALAGNRNLRILNVSCNRLEPDDLQLIFKALAQNNALEQLHCSNQLCASKVGWDVFQVLGLALKENRTLRKLGMDITEPHWRNQIHRDLVRNIDLARKVRLEARQQQHQQLQD